MHRSWFITVIAFTAMTAMGCSGLNVQKPAKSAEASAQASKKKQKQRLRPHIVAPPPAYGNRVVFAPADATPNSG